jgi:hypothetical protein
MPTVPTSYRNSLAKRRHRSRSIGSLLNNISSSPSSSAAQPQQQQPSIPPLAPLHQYHYRRRRESSAPFSNTEPIVIVSDTTPSNSIDDLNITSPLENGDATIWLDHPPSSSTNKGKKKIKNKKDWIGRWNLKDITEVQKGLRALK